MKVDLGKDPLFDRKQSPLQGLKDRERQKSTDRGPRKFSLSTKRELEVEIIDPLPDELRKFRQEVSYSRITSKSRAHQNLKKYISSQERNLKHVRLEKIVLDEDPQKTSSSVHSHNIKVNFIPFQNQNKKLKQIAIPKIDEFFKDQTKEKLIHQNRKLSKILGSRHTQLDETIRKIKQFNPDRTDQSFYIKDRDQDQKKQQNFKKQTSLIAQLESQKKVFNKLENMGSSSQQLAIAINQLSGTKKRRKQTLRGTKTYTIKQGNKTLQMTPPTMLLYQLHKISDQKDKKQFQLASLIKNSYQNRTDTMLDKSNFYDNRISSYDLSPQSQFNLRQQMNRKLSHRLQISKQQVHKFVAYLHEIKNEHIIISEKLMEILSKIRENLLFGKIMKRSDLQTILNEYKKEDLQSQTTQSIISRLFTMMI